MPTITPIERLYGTYRAFLLISPLAVRNAGKRRQEAHAAADHPPRASGSAWLLDEGVGHVAARICYRSRMCVTLGQPRHLGRTFAGKPIHLDVFPRIQWHYRIIRDRKPCALPTRFWRRARTNCAEPGRHHWNISELVGAPVDGSDSHQTARPRSHLLVELTTELLVFLKHSYRIVVEWDKPLCVPKRHLQNRNVFTVTQLIRQPLVEPGV